MRRSARGARGGLAVQLDNARIAVRERSYLENLDLGLRVVRAHAGPLLLALVLGALPAMLLNH